MFIVEAFFFKSSACSARNTRRQSRRRNRSKTRSMQWKAGLTLLDAAVFVHFAIVIPALHSRLSDRNQIWHTYSDGYGTDSKLIFFDPPDPRRVPVGILGGKKFKIPGNCPENQFFLNPTPPQGVQMGILGGQKFKSPGNVMDCPENQ